MRRPLSAALVLTLFSGLLLFSDSAGAQIAGTEPGTGGSPLSGKPESRPSLVPPQNEMPPSEPTDTLPPNGMSGSSTGRSGGNRITVSPNAGHGTSLPPEAMTGSPEPGSTQPGPGLNERGRGPAAKTGLGPE
jgi:hypothetical protein